ncbi:inositol monophosphatase [Epibacterium sp. MM17-32]|uniref:inositol monophosphatase family protein n=1 Tax=Epibacterium sp. MM17-32 TaxID=2917734 RepID=UPI001EF4385B|nr:inositol monophosphatase [Epibacterium sp. MM17-32]MCG7627927.1 inositol monophosphatase [Epibacterium sp. MM17-32]
MTEIAARLAFAINIAREAGQLARQMRSRQSGDFVSAKGPQDFVTEADTAVEHLLHRRLAAAYPADGFLGEEGGSRTSGRFTWVVDPIDGTTNFLRGLPEWGVSIACMSAEHIELGVIYLPDLDRLGWCSRAEGAYLDGIALDLSNRPESAGKLAILGHSDRLLLEDHLRTISGLLPAGYEYRRQGAACFGLLAVATGWADFYFEGHLNPWDALAGLLLVETAGGQVSRPALPQFLRAGGAVLASSGDLAPEILDRLQPPPPASDTARRHPDQGGDLPSEG